MPVACRHDGARLPAVLVPVAGGELAGVRYIRYDYWDELSGGSRLAAVAAARIRAGVSHLGVSTDRVLAIAQAVAGRPGHPADPGHDGPGDDLAVLEGHVRLTAFMLACDELTPELDCW
jgi:hypothetical protein